MTGRKIDWTYSEQACKGDHICYISNLAKPMSHYPGWSAPIALNMIFEEMVVAEQKHTGQVSTV